MSILIKGMEIPTSCNKCPFLDYEEGFCFASGVKHENGWYEFVLCHSNIKDGRHDACTLVPVPPHGRLIDAYALHFIKGFEEDDPLDYVRRYAIDKAPTIIPADKEGE